VADGDGHIEFRGKPRCETNGAEVRRDDHRVRRDARAERLGKKRNGREIVHRDSEESLQGRRMHVQRHDVVDCSALGKLRDEARPRTGSSRRTDTSPSGNRSDVEMMKRKPESCSIDVAKWRLALPTSSVAGNAPVVTAAT
jgi:hypothetical protein